MANFLKHLPKIAKRDVYGKCVIKYIVMDKDGFNIGEFDTKVDAFTKCFATSGSKVFKFMVYELLK